MKKITGITLPLIPLIIENDGVHLLIKVKINNKDALMVVDTGASRTVLDKNRVHQFIASNRFKKYSGVSSGLGTNNMESHIVKIKLLEMEGVQFKDLLWVLLDLSHVNESYTHLGLQEIDGVLGGDMLLKCNAVIDYGKNLIKLNLRLP